jgi:methionine-R-sulfoxide reductase
VNWGLVEKISTKTSWYTEQELREKLTPLQYKVTREQGTEPAFDNEYWDNKKPGIYVDLLEWTPLYSSLDKFDSGTGWPSFTKSIDENNLILDIDTRFFMTRTKVDSATSGSHLWHIFNDAPAQLWGIRHCINSASLKFIPVDELEQQWYGEYVEMFN